jgi:hypothetical protein
MQPVNRLPLIVRPGYQRLRANASLADIGRIPGPQAADIEIVPRLAGGVSPVFDENQLDAADDVALQSHVQIAIGIFPQTVVFLVGDIDAAGECDAPIDHHDLPVRTHVQPWTFEGAQQLLRVEPRHFRSRLAQRFQESPVDAVGADRIQQQPDRDAIAGAFDQGVPDAGARGMGLAEFSIHRREVYNSRLRFIVRPAFSGCGTTTSGFTGTA